MAKKKKKKTAKKKKNFSAKQIAAQKKFSAAAKAGTLKKGSKLKASSSKGGKKGGSKGGRRMAKKKRKRSKQGVVSWLVNVATLAIAAANPIVRAKEAMDREDWGHFARAMAKDYLGMSFDSAWEYQGFKMSDMARGTGTLAAAVGFKKVASYATKNIKIQSLIPGLR